MNLNEQLQQAYESGRRQALNEQIRRGPGVMSPRNAYWMKVIQARKSGDVTALRQTLNFMVKSGWISNSMMAQLMGASSFSAFLALLIPLGLIGLIGALGYGAFVAPGFKGLNPDAEFGQGYNTISQEQFKQRYPVSPMGVPGTVQP